MKRTHQLIGRIFALYCEGRADALAGRRRPALAHAQDFRYYVLGHSDETERMAAEKRLAQLELDLTVSETEGT